MIKISVNGVEQTLIGQDEVAFEAARAPTVEDIRRDKTVGLETDFKIRFDPVSLSYLLLKKMENLHEGGPALTALEAEQLTRLKAVYEYYMVTKGTLAASPNPGSVSTKGWPV